MRNRKRPKAKQNLFIKILQLHSLLFKWLIKHFLRNLLVLGKRVSLSKSGFVMPTVAMVTLVVILLTTVIALRSFDRSKNATNVRVNQAVLNAATPALDRARAKIEALLNDQSLPRGTPSDLSLYQAVSNTKYTLGDETRLKLAFDINNNSSIQANTTKIEDDETLRSAWKFPVDTDNNGKFDSYTLYSIYFRSPTRGADDKFNRARNPLEARTPPMAADNLGGRCADLLGNSNKLVGNSSWFKSGTKLKKSFFVYTATVPITSNNPPTGYETYQGSKGFSALELQQDQSRIALTNNAVVFQDDLEITPDAAFNLNGRIFTNANLLAGGRGGAAVRLYQVSSKNSCFYEEDNSKITVGGNVGTGNLGDITDQTAVTVDLYNGMGRDPGSATINGDNRSTTSAGGSQVGYNDAAYNMRIALMKQTAISYHSGYNTSTKKITPAPTVASVKGVTQYPQEVKNGFEAKINALGGSSLDTQAVLEDQIEIYLKSRTRRVPYAEVVLADGTNALGTYTSSNVFTSGTIEPPQVWREPINTNTNLTNTNLALTTANLNQTQPKKQKEDGKETYLGDRIYAGNNLPAIWKKDGQYVTGSDGLQFLDGNIKWTNPNNEPRYRTTQVADLPDQGMSNRDGDWENDAAKQPSADEPSVGGLRVITGAGIYVDDDRSPTVGTPSFRRSTNSFLREPKLDSGTTAPAKFATNLITSGNDNIVTWSDLRPMTGGADEIAGSNRKSDLQMRATAIYHYTDSSYTDTNYINRTPTACISSYYDPTNEIIAKNINSLPWNFVVGGRSNNGIVYRTSYTSDSGRTAAVTTYRTQLNRQARLIFPNGRIVNEPLRKALQTIDRNGTRSLADNSAIDTAVCAIKILDGSLTIDNSQLAHGAIKEASFLNAREIKAIDKSTDPSKVEPISPNELASAAYSTSNNYNLALEQRQPLEIRVTDIDMDALRTKTIGGATNQEYMLPNSGIIYATRDDALPDLSDTSANKELLSPTDFKLDPTRRPNGIRLLNGSSLARQNTYRQVEKGLILATNLPAYIKGDFNLHQKPGGGALTEEFMEKLDNTWSNFYSRNNTLDTDFACRKDQPGCGIEGDQWRPATIISDSMSLLSASFADGFRNQGDYDLNNSAGSSAIKYRLSNGLYENSFVPSALWWNIDNTGNTPYPSGKTRNSNVGSYLTNGVSPIQRRTGFPEYVMEICRKLPVSECQPSDWVVGFDLNGNDSLSDIVSAFDVDGDGVIGGLSDTEDKIRANQLGQALVASGKTAGADNILTGVNNITPPIVDEVQWSTRYLTGGNDKSPLERLGAGTTARPASVTRDQRYARRVAFGRDRSGGLVFLTIGIPPLEKVTAQPLGVGCPLDATGKDPLKNGCEYPITSNWVPGINYGTSTSNALWFRTTNNITSAPGAVGDISYAANRPLYYTPPTTGKLLLPNTECFTNTNTVDCSNYPTLTTGVVNLNYPTTTEQASDYALCLDASGANSGSSKAYQISKIPAGGLPPCPSSPIASIDHARNQMGNFTAGGYTGGFTTTAGKLTGGTITATAQVVVYDITQNTARSGSTLTLDAGLQTDAIFVLQLGSFSFGDVNGGNGVKVVLKGVSPNNVFWVNKTGSSRFENANANFPHQIMGNFLGKSASPTVGQYTEIMGRFLGFTTAPNFFPSPPTGVKITSITSTVQPVLAPVLQVHSPGGTPGNTLNTTTGNIQGSWAQQAGTNTTFNVAFVTGNSPSRPAEESAGLHNFVRFMETWNATVNIKGSFIQLKRSAYSTGPFSPIRSTGSAPKANPSASNNGSLSIFGYPNTFYPSGGGSGNTLTYYGAPTRQWRYDVALLSQPPDLFAQKFTLRSTNRPNEFFREIGRDDDWIKTLLCAAEANPPKGGAGATFTTSAISTRPSDCPVNLPYPANP